MIEGLAEQFATLLDGYKQAEEAHRGLREYMQANGWSPTQAEKVSAEALSAFIRKVIIQVPDPQ